MEYQEFLDIIGCSESRLNEEDYEELVQPVIKDRCDLFPIASAVATHYDRFGIRGFDEEFLEVLDKLTNALREARGEAASNMVPFEWLLSAAEAQSL